MKALRMLAAILAMYIFTGCGSAGTSTTDQQGTSVTVSEFGNVEGTVKDALTNSPVSGVSIQIGEKVSSTSETGFYSIQGVNTGTRTVMATKAGYDSYSGTVTDNVTGLMWQQQDDDITRNWADAGTYCDNMTLAGYADWRLPSIDELESIILLGSSPTIDTTYFPNTNASSYWSSTPLAYSTSYAWFVNFSNGYVYSTDKTLGYYVRCVR